MPRIAIARLMQETNALSPVPTVLRDFEQSHYLEGDDLLAAVDRNPDEVPGFFRKAELAGACAALRAAGATPVPILSAWASSGGKLDRACYDTLTSRLAERLRAARPDGVVLALHGAMGVDGVADPESAILRLVKDAVGDVPVTVTHDLHGNLTRARVTLADAIVGYQTNPHRDHARVGRKAAELALAILAGRRPAMAWRTLPMLLGGGKTIDFLAPMRAVFARMRTAERRRQVVSASTFMVHPWNDDPALGWSTLVYGEAGAAEALADELAEMCWARRHEMPPTFASAADALRDARAARLRRKLGVVTISDASDVVTAGAPGDSTHLLRAMLSDGAGLLTYAAVRDPVAIETLWTAPINQVVEVEVGGHLDPASGPPIPVRGRLERKLEQKGFLRTVVLAIDHVRLVVTEGPSMVMRPSFYKDVGLDLWKADVVMVKNFFPFLMFFLPYNRKTIFVRTSGSTDFDAAFRLTFDGPMHPRDPVDDWRPRDRARRGLAA
ncbi:MAG: M81 family metallopeptidase [Kofleriaceae bacterium]|jgi:microcystin degradation protein MlrC|nr:M81 family metallopeptidase [Kofleriaceae bacterium]MBP9168474.1 M81 family metallopeptidase [Kofleriaceae bacterium]MBP9858922.1 M81 family metallopeptidase [Kofleriaceae bacterium]